MNATPDSANAGQGHAPGPAADVGELQFQLLHRDRHSRARLGRLRTRRGDVQLPAFMPVGTAGTVKGLTSEMVAQCGTEMILGNTYHLALRPGERIIERLGGLHSFMRWPGPILTDSGGYQVFSLAQLSEVTDHSVVFRSHIDGQLVELTPQRSIDIQRALGSDIVMTLDHLPALPCDEQTLREATRRTVAWAERCRACLSGVNQALFGIVQGGLNDAMRRWCTTALVELDFDGYAIGGLGVGESVPQMYRIVRLMDTLLPVDKSRYLMGVGRPEDLLVCIARGVDMFDCVMPTRNGRNALAFTDDGPIRLRNAIHRSDAAPIQHDVSSPASSYSRAYLRHLFLADEMLGPILVSAHNLAYYQRLMREARQAIAADHFVDFFRRRMSGWGYRSEAIEALIGPAPEGAVPPV